MVLSLEWFHRKYNELQGTNNIWVAYSGGIDSTVLLELCSRYIKLNPNCKLQAIHINHGLNKNSDYWVRHCINICKSINIPLYVMPIKLDLNKGDSIEALARQARRTIWQALLPDNATLLLAHHAEDQAETILYRLFRGAGPTGLSGIKDSQIFGRGILLRPLLQVAKKDIQNFSEENTLSWITDDSNMDCKFDRNFIRHTIFPLLSKRWPKITDNIIRSGELCNSSMRIINKETKQLLLQCSGKVENTLSIKQLLALEEVKCFAVIRSWLENNNYQMPSYKQIKRIKDEVMLTKIDANPILNLRPYIIRRYRNDLYVLEYNREKIKSIKENIIININFEGNINVNNEYIIEVNKSIGEGIFLPAHIKEISLCVGYVGKKAKKIFQKYGIPPWDRSKYPLIFYDKQLLGIIGLWIKSEYIAKPGQRSVIIRVCML